MMEKEGAAKMSEVGPADQSIAWLGMARLGGARRWPVATSALLAAARRW